MPRPNWRARRSSTLSLLALGVLAASCGRPIVVTVVPTSLALHTGDTFAFTANVAGARDPSVVWTVREGAVGGFLSSNGVYTAPATQGTYHVTATAVEDPTASATAEVTVTPRNVGGGVSVSVSPQSLTLPPGAGTTLVATVTGTANGAVTWKISEGSTGGSLSVLSTTSARYTAAGAGVFHVVATSVADTTKSATVTVTVQLGAIFVDVSPQSVNLARVEGELAAVSAGRAATALAAWDMALAMDPYNAVLRVDAANTALLLHDEARARAWAEQNVAAYPDYGPPRAQLAFLSLQAGDAATARAQLERALAGDWHDDARAEVTALTNLAAARLAQGDVDAARALAESALERTARLGGVLYVPEQLRRAPSTPATGLTPQTSAGK